MKTCAFLEKCSMKRTYSDYLYFCSENHGRCVRYQDLTKGKEQTPAEWKKEIEK